MSSFITTTAFSVERASAFNAAAASGQYFLFAADHRPNSNTTLPTLSDAVANVVSEPWQQMILGVQVSQTCLGIDNLPYQFGTVYQSYDDQVDLTDQQWYAIVNAGSFSHIFACLQNGGNVASTIPPSFTQAIASQQFTYQTSDGYEWMYLCTTDSATIANLATTDWFPLIPNTAVSAAAVEGSLQVVSVSVGGKGYDNYLSGTFQASDVAVGGNPQSFQVSNTIVASVNGYYQGCVLLITGGTGVGQFATVTNFTASNTGNYVGLDQPFLQTPTSGSTWQMMPGVVFTSDETQTVEAVAYAQVNALASNSVWGVQVLNPGAGYVDPVLAAVFANSVVGVTLPAAVRPIVPPRGGHGFDAATELGATAVLLGATFANSEGGTVPATNTYRQVGLLNDPTFANVGLTVSGSSQAFSNAEPLLVMTLAFAAANASTNSSSVVVQGDTRMFVPGSSVYVAGSGEQFLGQVNTVTNSTSMNLTSNSAFTSNSQLTLYLASIVSNGTIVNPVSPSNAYASGLSWQVNTGMTAYGTSSMTAGTITATARSGVTKPFGTFVQLWTYLITIVGGQFVPNEWVIQGGVEALVHSQPNSSTLYVSNPTGPFAVGGPNLVGNTSGAIAQVNNAWSPELVVRSGTIDYLECVEPVTRSANGAEAFVIPFLF